MERSFKQRLYENFKWMPIIRRLYESHVLRSVDLQYRMVEHVDESWALGTLMGLAYDPIVGEDIAVDFHLSRDQKLWAADGSVISRWSSKCGIPANIAMQAYWTMLCTGCDIQTLSLHCHPGMKCWKFVSYDYKQMKSYKNLYWFVFHLGGDCI